uniref:G-protein coupled receptors family 3 profile domain-containing protein n=1 Tax=Anolis carolinensis TaxID=28377 RepID=H9GHN6_ANOCA
MRMGLFVLFALSLSFTCGQVCSSALNLEGDYSIAGLFPLHRSSRAGQGQVGRPQVEVCLRAPSRSAHGYHLVQAMRFAVSEVNRATDLLPNVTLGYEIYDACGPLANLYATLRLLSEADRAGRVAVPVAANYTFYRPRSLAAIGPDSSQEALTTAILLGAFLVPEVSYEATSPTLSQRRDFPFFPADGVEALVLLLSSLGWTWVGLVGSDNDYGRQGLRMLQEVAPRHGICFAYQGFLPASGADTELVGIVRDVSSCGANVAVVFANKNSARAFMEEAVRQNVTGKVWVGTEDWSLSTEVWSVGGVSGVGTVLGVSVEQAHLPGMQDFEAVSATSETEDSQPAGCSRTDAAVSRNEGEMCSQACSRLRRPKSLTDWEMSPHDIQGAFSVYSAVYAVAHGLHRLLGCHTGPCRKQTVYPWQLLREVREVDFNLSHRRVRFDENGDTAAGYDLVQWVWEGQEWGYRVIGSFEQPDRLDLDQEKIRWHTQDNQVPTSVCSRDCGAGEQKVPQGTHRCCFHCVACLPGTFLNRSDDLYTCQKCRREEWSPSGSESCFPRETVFLPFSDPVSLALLTAACLLLSLLAFTAALFVRHLGTPVVRSAGGPFSLVMLGASDRGRLGCLLRMPLYNVNLSLCLSCMLTRSIQIALIFKAAGGLYDTWRRVKGPALLIVTLTGLQGLMVVISFATNHPTPRRDYSLSATSIFLLCSSEESIPVVAGGVYNGFLGVFCFGLSYLGKDLPSSYSEAKCLTFSLMVYFTSSISYVIASSVYVGRYLSAMYVASLLVTLGGVSTGYFSPKVFLILFRPELNTNQHFQMSIQSYTKRINAGD